MGSKMLTYEYVKKYVELDSKSSCELLSKEYKGRHHKLLIKCKCSDEFNASYASFRFKKSNNA